MSIHCPPLLPPELLLGPTFATSKVLRDMNLALSDVGVIEFHEAFAGTYNTVLHYFALYYTVHTL